VQKNRLYYLDKKSRLTDEKCEQIFEGINNLNKKYFWTEQDLGWMKSKERTSINQYKLVNKLV